MADTTEVDLDPETGTLRLQMEESREALTQKIEMLEEKVTETVQSATDTVAEATANVLETVQSATASVTGTVDNVTSAVQGTVDSVRQSVEGTVDSVREAFDLNRQVQQHPWWMLAGAVAAGYVGGSLLNGMVRPSGPIVRQQRSRMAESLTAHSLEPSHSGFYPGPAPPVAPTPVDARNSTEPRNNWLSQLTTSFAPEIAKLESLAIGVMMGSVRDMVLDAVPTQAKQQLTEVIDGVTEKLGGKCIRGQCSTTEVKHQY